MDCPVLILLAALIGTAWTSPTDQGPQKRSPEPIPEPKALPEPQPKLDIEYQDIIMYLTPSQISQLEQTQKKHEMILEAAEVQEENENKAVEQYLSKQQEDKYVEKQPLRQISKDLEQYLKLQDSAVLQQQLLKEKSRQLKQKQQNQQEASVLKQQQLKEQGQQYLKQQNSKELEQQLLKQSRYQQQYFNQQNTKQLGQRLLNTQSQTLEQQHQTRKNINQLEQQLLNQRSKELEELFIKEQEERELIEQLQKQPKSATREFSPYWYLQQLQNSTEQKNKESSRNLKQKYVTPQSSTRSFETLAPQTILVPKEEPKVVQVKPVVEEEPQLQYVFMDGNGVSISIPLDVLRQQLILKPESQERLEEQRPPESKKESMVQNKLRIVPYKYTPEQQERHLQFDEKILEKLFVYQEQAKKELETGLKLNKENKKVQKLGQYIYEHQILPNNPVIHQFNFTRETFKFQKPLKLESINQEEAEILDDTESTDFNPVEKLPKEASTLQELASLAFLQKLSELENENKDYFTHLDLLNQQNKLAKLQTTIKNKDRKFTSEELEQEIKNIQQEIKKVKASTKTITKSKTHDAENDAKTTKPIKVEAIKWKELPPSNQYVVPEPYIVKVPVNLINRYAVNTK